MKNIVLQNVSPIKQTSWVFVASKEDKIPDSGHFGKFPFYKTAHGILVKATLQGGEKQELVFNKDPAPEVKHFAFSSWVGDSIAALIPSFECDGQLSEPLQFFDGSGTQKNIIINTYADPIKATFYFRTQIRSKLLTIEGWVTYYNNQDHAEFVIHSTYGNVTSTSMGANMGILYMITGEIHVVDYAKRKGLGACTAVDGKWKTPIAAALERGKAQRVQVRGAMLCLPSPLDRIYSEILDPTTRATERIETLQARQLAPICGISKSWQEEDKWLVFGKTPLHYANEAGDLQYERQRFLNGLATASHEYVQRPYASMKLSGTTGDQADFGACRGSHAVTSLEPWAIFDYLYSTDMWALRPTGNKEDYGERATFAGHPNARSYSQGIDFRFSMADLMGWPSNWNTPHMGSGCTTLDEQHRSDNYLYACYALTRCPGLESIILDTIELDRWGVRERATNPATWPASPGSPRAIGRLLMTKANQVHLGFAGALPSLMETLVPSYTQAHYRSQPATNAVKVLSVDNPATYGWMNAQGQTITGWVAWQEAMGVMGFYAAYKVTGDERCLEVIREVGRTLVNHAFWHNGTHWTCAASMRWNNGEPLPQTSYNYNQPNYDLIATGMFYVWCLGAVKIFARCCPEDPAAARANQIITEGGTPNTSNDASWWCV